ncbi:ComEC/Rec2 family competence protein [Pedobacter sp. Du54]|uniref:ComEC/Rec2 family competence protein n=1 Tax=Pedobacter anseongensis TaxID=3133439 RepID=UPI0030A81A9E
MIISAEIIFVRILIPLLLGIFFFYNFETKFHLQLSTFFTAFIATSLLGINLLYKSIAAYRFKYVTGGLFALLFFFFGGWINLLCKDTLKSNYFGNQSYDQLKIWVNDEPQIGNGTIRFTANITTLYKDQTGKNAQGKLLINIKTDSLYRNVYKYGDELIISAECTPIQPPFNPGEFDFKAWLALKNVHHQAFVSQKNVIKTGVNKGNPLLKYALTLRKSQVDIYERIIKDKEAFAVASTLILGYRADLSNETLSSYSKTGTIHALSVSGMHVGIIYIVLNWLLRFLDKKRSLRILKIILICSLIWFYSLLTGFSPSILRSAIMLTVYILAKSFNKHTNGYNILAFTAFCMLICNPFLIWDVGFQLSFLAVLGLIYLYPKIYKWFYFKQRWIDWIWSSIALSVAAQIATFPLSIYYFHQFPLYFIFSNLFILLPITLLMYLGISILLFKLHFLAPIFQWLIIFMNNGLKWIANLPFSGINQIWIDKIQLSLLTLALILSLLALTSYKKLALLSSFSLLFIFQLSVSLQTIKIKKQRKILFFSLHKGYAAAFINAQHAVLLSNLNHTDKNFQFYLQPALNQLHITEIQFVKWEIDTNFKFFTKKNHQINFFGYNILLLDSYFNRKIINKIPIFNMVWLHRNPKFQLQKLRNQVLFETLVIDATNYENNLKTYIVEANKFHIQSYVLKKNKAYLIDLNHPPK